MVDPLVVVVNWCLSTQDEVVCIPPLRDTLIFPESYSLCNDDSTEIQVQNEIHLSPRERGQERERINYRHNNKMDGWCG